MIDTSVLSQLFESEETIGKFVSYFVEEMPRNMEELSVATKSIDFDNAAIISHNIKSQLKYLNEQNGVQLAAEIELLCDNITPENIDLIQLLIKKLQAELDLILYKSNQYLQGSKL
jgi:HPt (histidine-containing phosphotransfer) domain-containing protein